MDRVQFEIFLGTIIVLATTAIVLIYGFNEKERMAEFEKSHNARAIETGATLFEAQCSRCHGTQGLGIPGLCPPLNDRYFFDQRLADIGWSGTLEDYIVSTASSGRLSSTRPELYPGQGTPAMPSFSDQFGGPLREDQIRSIASFIINWEETATLVEAPPIPEGPIVGTEITKELPEGDQQSGETLATKLACTACHIDAPTGPYWLPNEENSAIGERAVIIIDEPNYTGNAVSAHQYLFESIVLPGSHIIDGFSDGVMPNTYANTLTDQEVADLIAYLLSMK